MKIDLTSQETVQLLLLGLMHEDSPIQIADGFAARDLKTKQNGGASFELVDKDDIEVDLDEND